MKIAVLADIHGNLEALAAVSGDISRRGADRVICLGDNVGYGADPDEVVRHIRDLGYQSILGNHEMALNDPRARLWLNFQAAENNAATAQLLSPDNLCYCRDLPKSLVMGAGYFVHGFPPASVFRYLNLQSDERLAKFLATATSSLYFVGHTHKLQLVHLESGEIVRRPLRPGRVTLQPGEKYIVNAGSVGQPRDGDNRAKYLLWDSGAATIEVVCVAYDCHTAMEKIRGRGFPGVYASLLG